MIIHMGYDSSIDMIIWGYDNYISAIYDHEIIVWLSFWDMILY